MKRTRRPRLGRQGWQTVMARFAQSGLSAQAFCEQERLNIQSLYRWRAKLEGVPTRCQQPVAKAAIEPIRGGGFIDLGALGASGSRLELRLDLGGGVRLHLVRE
jgi:putative transposase